MEIEIKNRVLARIWNLGVKNYNLAEVVLGMRLAEYMFMVKPQTP